MPKKPVRKPAPKIRSKAGGSTRTKPPVRRASHPAGARKASTGRQASGSWPTLVSFVTLPVDTSLYPMEAVYGASYTFLDRAYVHLSKASDRSVEVRLVGRTDLDAAGLRSLGGEFVNELLNQVLRITLDESGRKIREYIVAKAHFFQDQGGREVKRHVDSAMQGAFDEDPLDIAVPWEQKYGDRGSGKC